jgi:predicted O-linked N-acetylglucosamine transferase (SPINDLY family)
VVALSSEDQGAARRIGFIAGEFTVPDDFDEMYQEEIIRMFEGQEP